MVYTYYDQTKMDKIDQKNIKNNTNEPITPINRVKTSEEDEEVANIGKEFVRIRQSLMPYQKYIMIGGLIILIFLVVFLGYAYGGLKVCDDLDGLLDDKFKCHPGFFTEQGELDLVYINNSPYIFNDGVYNRVQDEP